MVTLLAFGRHGYAHAAVNMVASIRHHGYAGPIHLHVGAGLLSLIPPGTAEACTINELPEEYTMDPGWCKVNLPELFKGDDTLYLDVDGICLRDITPLIEILRKDGRDYITSVIAQGKLGETIEYFEWATPQKVAEMHDLKDATYYGIQSSWAYFKRSPWLKKFHAEVLKTWEQWSISDLRNKWGKGKPDELFYAIACSIMKHDPSHQHIVHFGKGFDQLPEVRKTHYILSLYGVGRGRGTVPPRFVEQYDAEVRTIGQAMPWMQLSKAEPIRRDKYANFKN